MKEEIKLRNVLQKIVNFVLEKKEYSDFDKAEVLSVYKAPYKTAWCDITYDLKIYTDVEYHKQDDIIRSFCEEIREYTSSVINETVCAIDIKFLSTYSL